MEYADVIWSPYQQYLISKIERVQNLALRFIYSVYSRHSSVTTLRNRANLQKLEQRRDISSLKFLYQLYYGHYKLSRQYYIQEPFKHSARTNHSKTIRQPISHTNLHKFSLFPRAISYWNMLPEETVNSVSLEVFSQRISNICFG